MRQVVVRPISSMFLLVLYISLSCVDASSASAGDGGLQSLPASTEIEIVHTGDEHGWIEAAVEPVSRAARGGMADFAAWLLQVEGYDPNGFILLSSGDNWTGQAVSTHFKGEPMVEAFNLLAYDAVAIGNHEFDFGRLEMLERFDGSYASYLGANILWADMKEHVEFAEPFVIIEVGSVKVGIIGLSSTDTPVSAHPLSTLDLVFADYVETLEEMVPRARRKGAQVVIVLAHVCRNELERTAREMNVSVDAMFGGHCHELFIDEVSSIPLMGSGWAFRHYGRMTLRYDRYARAVTGYSASHVPVERPSSSPGPASPDPDIMAVAREWKGKDERIFNERIGFSSEGIGKSSWAMSNWVTDSWLWAFPEADAAVLLFGGFRQDLPAGHMRISDIIGILPFDNELYRISVTGAQLAGGLAHGFLSCSRRHGCRPGVGGISYRRDGEIVHVVLADDSPIEPDRVYTVLVTDYLYYGGEGYAFLHQDPDAMPTGVNYRDPVVEWTKHLYTSPSDPLENHLDAAPRGI